MKALFITLSITATLVSLSACSAKVTSTNPIPDGLLPLPSNNGQTVTNDFVQGTWSVNCEKTSSGWLSLSDVFQGNRLTTSIAFYQDSSCSQVYMQQQQTGTFTLATDPQGRPGYYAIDFDVDADGQNGAMTNYNIIEITGNTLYEGNEDPAIRPTNVDTTVGLQKGVALINPTPPPSSAPSQSTDPSTVEAVLATSWSEVKYAFCSTQGTAVLIDFAGTDLSVQKSGTFRFGTRPCDGSQSFQWENSKQFTSTADNQGVITLDFGASEYGEDTIEMDLDGFHDELGIIEGNSGPCTFLKNMGTKDLFENQPFGGCR